MATTVTETVPPHATNGVAAANGSPVVAKLQAAAAAAAAPTVHATTVSNIVVPAVHGAADAAADIPYTTFHLAGCSFVHPEGRPSNIRQCCAPKPAPTPGAPPKEQLIRLYHSEPSHFSYNRGCDVIRESRYSTAKGWHAPAADDLVADDVAPGSAIASMGWWSAPEVYETRVYYIDKNGYLRERWNRTSFKPEVHDTFDTALPAPSKLVPPHPGWSQTTLRHYGTYPANDADHSFVEVKPSAGSKIAAVRSEDGSLSVYYQTDDNAVCRLLTDTTGRWNGSVYNVLGSTQAKKGSPLTVVTGGWNEMRLFYVTPKETLAGTCLYDAGQWTPSTPTVSMPAYKLLPSAMLSAVAWNYASAFFEIRIFSTDDKNDLYEYHFDRHNGGWAPAPVNINKAPTPALSPASGTRMPLSAVVAVIVDDEWKTKVFFHPRRTIAEWDVCSKSTAFNGIPKVSAGAAARRQIEEETRAKIKAEQGKKTHDADEAKKKHDADEAKKKHDADEAKKKHDADEAKKKHDADEAKKHHPLPHKVVSTYLPRLPAPPPPFGAFLD
ncbi:hypothetical protein N658DRAFT_420143 [Parathielavia hyrcaniae]|uniref:Fucose-specific lectin n=1 Tax=Parathielavia hyrcaniae TaxID=113614 RepID=A0AAN6QBN5_9PEZI|nr:hypothetical protein N658DRAFT_420143 [Parathielavia hyrcaniae]